MRLRRPSLPPQLASAGRVAAAATLVIAVVYGGCVLALNELVGARLVAGVDARLSERLADFRPGSGRDAGPRGGRHDDDDSGGVPVVLWWAVPGRAAASLSSPAPALPAGLPLAAGRALTARIGTVAFRLMAARRAGSLLVAGESLAVQDHIQDVLLGGEALAAPVLLLAMFAGSLIIGLRALSPVEQSRQRQLEFTADASHELRTPLSVISAETSIALSGARQAGEYRAALERINGENSRLRKIVEDMLWLARFDSRPPPPGDEPLELSVIAEACADRFASVAAAQDLDISVSPAGGAPVLISAPPEWIDRLAGVLMDNACRYAGPGGRVRIGAAAQGSSVSLVVEDSGPGIPAAERPRLFDRFHRATEQGGGAGLGLAIADSIVRSTGGHWRIGESALGGALFEVSWRRSAARMRA
jgi:signal transduction histidine kinase